MGKPAATARWKLRVQAEGAQGLKAAGGLLGSLDAKPDPYVVFEFNGATKKCAHVDDVEPLQYFAWPNAVAEFDVPDEALLQHKALVVHVKDSDPLKDRYIGGTSIPLASLGVGPQGVLCQSRFFALEFEDEKLKKKKPCGEVKLTMSVVDTMKTPEPVAATVAATQDVTGGKPDIVSESPPSKRESPVAAPPPEKATTASTMEADTKLAAKPEPPTLAPAEPAQAVDPIKAEPPSATVPLKEVIDAPRRLSQSGLSEGQISESQNAAKRSDDKIETPEETGTARNSDKGVLGTPTVATANIKTLKIELVEGRNLTRPTSIGALFDRKPDPMVTFEFYGISKSTVALKDVDLKKPVEWTNTFISFELPTTTPPSKIQKGRGPLDLVVHVKDENLMKATYMGGGKIDLSEFFEPRSEENGWSWKSPSTNVDSPQDRVVTLTHSDEKLSKKKACGEITLRFHFEGVPVLSKTEEHPPALEISSNEVVQETPVTSTGADSCNTDPVQSNSNSSSTSQSCADEVPVRNEDHDPKGTPDPKHASLGDVKMLSVELLSGRGLSKPKVNNLAKSMMKSLFDRKPDPCAVMILGSETRKCPAVNDVDVSFFEWEKAVQVFEFSSKPYPETLVIHIRDEDIAGSDPFMGGARILMEPIWKEAHNRAISDPPGDPQLVSSYPLTFADEKMTKQKDCGSVTIRFRWIYSEKVLPVVDSPMPDGNNSVPTNDAKETLLPVPPLKARTGFLYVRRMVLYNDTQLLDPSLDLYIEVSCPSIHESQLSKHKSTEPQAVSAKSSVLTDATKGKDGSKGSKVEWMGDELVVPICLPLDGENADFSELRVDLKDKNAIMKDSEVAMKRVRLKDYGVDFTNFQPVGVTLELIPVGNHRKSTTNVLNFGAEIQFLPHDSPLLTATATEHRGGMVTLFLMRSVLSLSTSSGSKEPQLERAAFTLEISCKATKKTGLMSIGKSSAADFHSDSLTPGGLYKNGRSMISWWSTYSFPVTNKQAITAKEKEELTFEVAIRMSSGKTEKIVGSIQLNEFSSVFTPSQAARIETIQFGELGSMTLEFAATFRPITDESTKAAPKASQKPVAPPVPSGYLHIIILHAKNLISPDAKAGKAEDLDPEVRVSIEPKYVKRKDNPVRSMLKTKPLENAGATPTWNEYLRLEYLLPPLPLPQLQNGNVDQRRSSVDEAAPKYPPPVVQIGVFDIQMPGEKNPVQAIGKTELPLSAFLLGASSVTDGSGNTSAGPIQLALDIFLADKKTGVLVVEGVFEPAQSEFKAPPDDPVEIYRQRCRTIGRDMRERSKKLKSGELNITTTSLLSGSTRKRGVAGRLEVNFVGYRGGPNALSSDGRGLSAHVWISSSVDDRRELKSGLRGSEELEGECQIVWDAQVTLFTPDITVDMLRSEILTLTGKPVGSLKLPLGGLLEQGGVGRKQRAWHDLVDTSQPHTKKPPTKSKESGGHTQEVLLELTFFADQVVFDPLSVPSGMTVDSATTIVVDCGKVVVVDGETLAMTEIACKCSLLGSTPATAGNDKSQAPVERTGFKACEAAVGMDGKGLAVSSWGEEIKLEVGGSAFAYITQSFATGTQPALRFELFAKRQGARFHETIASLSLSLVTTLTFPGRRATRWLKFLSDGERDGTDVRLSAVVQVEIAAFCSSLTSFSAIKEDRLLRKVFEDMPSMPPVPGVLCLRFLSGRNLVDVDANGEQDPYIIAKINPRSRSSGQMQSVCQTGVSLDGGRHPTWNTSIFELQTQDLLTDYLRVEVIDSNEEDHIPDAYIGAIDIALVSLFREHVIVGTEETTGVWQTPKTRWLEAWIPIFAVSPIGIQSGDTDDNVGEIRMEFRFLTEDYYESMCRQQTATTSGSSPFTSVDSLVTPLKGILCLHVAQALNLSCTTGMQPGVRIGTDQTRGMFITEPGKKSITDPVWDNQVFELSWPPEAAKSNESVRLSKMLKVEVVDLAVRTANANAYAVVAFGQIDISSFLSHALARSYHVYPLHGRKASTGQRGPSILIGCQFVPEDKQNEVSSTLQKQEKRQEKRNGSLHVKCTQVRLDVAHYLNSTPLGARLSIRLRCCASKTPHAGDNAQCVEIPIFSLVDLVEKHGFIELKGDASALLFQYTGESISSESSFMPNPILVGELLASQKNEDVVAAAFEVPIFDYVLFDGHLGSAWYSMFLTDPNGHSSAQVGEVRLEVQFLPVLPTSPGSEKATEPSSLGVALIEVAIKQVTRWTAAPCCVVVVELFGCSAETKPNRPSASQAPPLDLCWSEVLDLAVPKGDIRRGLASSIMTLEIRDASDVGKVYGSCNWVVPASLFGEDGSLAVDSDEVVVPIELPAGISSHVKSKPKSQPPELTFQLLRMSQATETSKSGAAGVARRRRGLLYIDIAGDANRHNVKAALVASTEVDNLILSDDAAWIELSKAERKVISVYADSTIESNNLVMCTSDPGKPAVIVAIGTLDGQVLGSVMKAPARETFHKLPMRSVKDAGPAPSPHISCKLMYLETMQGQLQLQFDSVAWTASKESNGKVPGMFRLEVRLLNRISQRWVNSPIGFWNRKANAILWGNGKNEITLGYTNMDELTEPVVQLVLVQLTENDQPKKEAFGQFTVLSAIASNDSTWRPGTAELSRIDSGATKDSAQLTFQLRFVREEFSFEELEAKLAAERAKKALELAEGTATLKKAFAVMGGDERTPIAIVDFMNHVKAAADSTDTDLNAVRALDVLQHAADIETDGDLNELFALMDVNGDGQISWDEYVEHMQNIHALADAAATQSFQKQANAARPSPTDIEKAVPTDHEHGEDDEDNSGGSERGDEPAQNSDLEPDHTVEMPVRQTKLSADTPAIRDVYSLSPPAGEATNEDAIASKRASTERSRSSKASNKLTESAESSPEIKAPVNAKRTSMQPPRAELPPEEPHTHTQPIAPKKKLPTLSTYVLEWKVDEVIQWMEHEMELSQYSQVIQQNAINGKLLLTLREEELETELGVTAVLHKRKIMNQIREFQERFQYPAPDVVPVEQRKRPVSAKRIPPTAVVTASMVSETPSFIKREQLVFQEKQRAKLAESDAPYLPRTLGQSRVFPSKTKLVGETVSAERAASPAPTQTTKRLPTNNNTVDEQESFDDAMQDIFEVVHPDSPEKQQVTPATSQTVNASQKLPRLPLIQIGSVTNTDELFEIVRQRIHQLSQLLLPMANEGKESWSDFGDDPDDNDDGDQEEPPGEELTGLHLVFDAFRNSRPSASTTRISRLKFQEGLADLLSIEVSWHQFDLLFRRLDVDGDSELCWDEFHHVFTRQHISFEREDLSVLQDALVDFAMARLESQQWTLSDLFKAFDRDGGGSVSIAEFATLVRFLFTSSRQVRRFQQQTKHKITKRHVYLLMSCLDASADRRISAQEFLRFFFIVWSNKLMQVQDQLLALEAAPTRGDNTAELVSSLRQAKRTLRRALRTNFSRPFRDAMRCLDVAVPGPFSGLLARLELTPSADATVWSEEDHQTTPPLLQETLGSVPDGSRQVWQVLRGHATARPGVVDRLSSREHRAASRVARTGKNEVQRTRLTRQRAPSRGSDTELRTPAHAVALDGATQLKFDFRPVL